MFLKPTGQTVEYLEKRAFDFGVGCEKVYVSLSGGVDSAVVVTLLCRTFGAENVVAMYRDIRSNTKHLEDVKELQKVLGFKLRIIDANPMYDEFLRQVKNQFEDDEVWYEEGSQEANKNGWDGAYGSLKSRFTTPFAGFISKIIDRGRGRIYGTGNAEEDVLLRYFDKFGDGAVDNNIISGLIKIEVRQIALYFAEIYQAVIFYKIAAKTPSADLQSNGDEHNDESELTSWAKNMGFDIEISYGDLEKEGNIAWALKENLDQGVITGDRASLNKNCLRRLFKYNQEQIQVILFLREIEKSTRHKELGIPGVPRIVLREKGLVD